MGRGILSQTQKRLNYLFPYKMFVLSMTAHTSAILPARLKKKKKKTLLLPKPQPCTYMIVQSYCLRRVRGSSLQRATQSSCQHPDAFWGALVLTLPRLQKCVCKVPILLFGSREDRSRLSQARESQQQGIQVCWWWTAGEWITVRGCGGGCCQREDWSLEKMLGNKQPQGSCVALFPALPLKRLSNQFAPRNMLIANGAH